MLDHLGPFLPLRQQLMDQLNLDLFTIALFWERFVINYLHFDSTENGCPWDGVSNHGLHIEIKYAQTSQNTYGASYPNGYKTFAWQALQGCTNQGKTADYYILIGYNPSPDMLTEANFRVLGLTKAQMGHRQRLVMPVRCRYRSKFEKYITSLDQIRNKLQEDK